MEEVGHFELMVLQVVFFEELNCGSEGLENFLLEMELIVSISLF